MKATDKALTFLLLLLFSFNIAFAQWWDLNWKDRIQVNVTNKENDFVFNMSVAIPLNTQVLISQGKMKNDCSDIRVLLNDSILVNSVGVKDCNSANSQIVFKYNFSALETKTFYIYFNNPNALNILMDWKKAYYALYEDFNSGSTNLFDDYQYITNGGWVISYDSTYGYILKRRFSGDCGDTFCRGSYVSKDKVASRNAKITFDKYVVGNSCGDYSGFGFTSVNGNYNYENKGYTSYTDMGNGDSNPMRITNITTSWSGINTNLTVLQGYYTYTFIRNKTHGIGCIGSSCSNTYYFSNYQNFPSELYVLLWHSQSSTCAGFVDNVRVENIGINGYQIEISVMESFGLSFNMTIIPSSSVSYGTPVNVTCLNNNLYRNGTDVTSENSTYVILPAGTWNYTCGPESQLVNVSKASSSVTLNLSPSSPITYGTASSATCYSNHAQASLYLLRNGTNVGNESLVLPAGVWNYTCYIPESQNYTFASSSILYTVNKALPSVTLMIAPSSPITYGTTTNAVCYGTNPETSVILYRNGINVGNHSLLLAAGTYNYTCYSPPTQNYSSAYQEISYTVNKAVNTANLYINGTQNQNYYLRWPNGIYVYGTCSNSNNIQPQLYRNGTLISGASETTQLSVGNWTYNVYCDSNQNYTSDSKSYWAFASKLPQIKIGMPNKTVYYFMPNETKVIPVAWNTSSILSTYCLYSLNPDLGNTSSTCSNHYVFRNTSYNTQRFYLEGVSNFFTNADTYFGSTSYARVLASWNYNYDLRYGKPRNCTYVYYYTYVSGYNGVIVWSPFHVITHYLGSYDVSLNDASCEYLNRNISVNASSATTGMTFRAYPTYVNFTQESQYFYYPNSIGLKELSVHSYETDTNNYNYTTFSFFVDFTNLFNIRNNKGQHLPAKITFSNSTYNYTVQGTSPLYVNTSQLPYGFVTAYVESPNYIPQTLYFNFNKSTLLEYNITMINSGVYIKVLHEQSRAPINWYKLAITNSSDRNEVNFNTMTSGSYTTYLTVGKGYPSTPFQEFLDDDLNTYKDNPNANFTYNFGFTNATFEVWYESNGGGTIQIRAWNNVLGKWDDIKTISTGTVSKTMQTFNINNKPIPELNITTGYYGDLYQNCEGYYCPLFEVKTTGNIRLYEIRLVYPYSYNKDGYLSMNYTDFGMATGRSRITASSPLFSGTNFYGERTYYVNPTTEVATNLNIYLYPNCLVQQFYALETIPFSETPKAIKGALFTIYKEFEGTIYPVDQEISSELGSAYLCVDPTSSYIFTVTHEDYKPFYSYSISFSNPNQPINVFMEVLPKESMSFPYMYFETQCKWSDNVNTYDENQTYQMFGKKCPDRLPDNATSFMYTCFVNTYNTKVKINYGGLYVYRKAFPNYGSNFTLPIWNESSLPYNMNETEKFEMIYNVTSNSIPLLFNYLALDEGDYIFICYVNYDWLIFRNFTNYYTKYETRILFDKKEILAPSGKSLISGIDKNALWLIGLLFTMMVTGFFSFRFGVNSLLIFFLTWGLVLTIFGGWGLNFPTGVLILAILIWLALTFGRW